MKILIKKLPSIFIVVAILVLGIYLFRNQLARQFFTPQATTIEQGVILSEVQNEQVGQPMVEVVAEDLEIPWEVAFLPNGEILVTERPGRLLKIGSDREVIEIDGVAHVGEGGLLGLVLHPNFKQNGWLYLYLTTEQGERLINRVERYRLENNQLTDRVVVVSHIPGAKYHDGGRLEFGPDGYLYVSTGDAQVEPEAQNSSSIHGTILRVKDDGSLPEDNPFGTAVYSYGHRNVQGLAWDDIGQLWVTEHGRSGLKSGLDELNLIKAGANYGWPEIEGDQSQAGMTPPVLHSGAETTWAPAGLEFYNGKLFFAGLRGESLYEVTLDGDQVTNLKMHFPEEFGRLRAVRLGPDGYLYITTSNRDGRGVVQAGDDKLIRVNPELFGQ